MATPPPRIMSGGPLVEVQVAREQWPIFVASMGDYLGFSLDIVGGSGI